jgi:uncharacterized membrane protein YccC
MPRDAAAVGPPVRHALTQGAVLTVACLVAYILATQSVTRLYLAPRADDLIGGLWAVIATIFVCRDSVEHSLGAAVTRTFLTLVSFGLCMVYLIFLPFHVWAMAVLIGLSAFVTIVIGRSGDAVTACITTAVVMVSAAVSPDQAWRQPILRCVDTVIGVAVGVAAVWLSSRAVRHRSEPGPAASSRS